MTGAKVQSLPVLSAKPDLDELGKALGKVITLLRDREPSATGTIFQKFITYQRAIETGLLSYTGGAFGGTGGGTFVPSVPPPDFGDGPPDPITGLEAHSSVAFIMVEWDAPSYGQGGGNAYTEVWAANYSGSGPEPTFADAVQVGTASGRSPIFVMDAEPGVEKRFWVGAVTYGGVRQIDATGPTGGLHGITATADLLDSQHIISLTAAKLTAGSIAVGEDITSTGFVSGSAGWRWQGNGNMEANNGQFRGGIYATYGLIGGAAIGASGVQSTNYFGGSLGWRLDNATGRVFAYGGVIGGFTIAGQALTAGTAELAGTGSGVAIGIDGGTPKLFVGDATHGIFWDGVSLVIRGAPVATDNVQADAITYVSPSSNQADVAYTSSAPTGVYEKFYYQTNTDTYTGAKLVIDPRLSFSITATFLVAGAGNYVDVQPFVEEAGTIIALGNPRTLSAAGGTGTFTLANQVADLVSLVRSGIAGSRTYKIGVQVRRTGVSVTATTTVHNGSIVVTEIKR